MPAVAYAMRDHAPTLEGAGHMSIPADKGGCGVIGGHAAQVDDRGHVYYECDRCAPIAIATHYGFTATPGGVPLCPDEIEARELAKRDAETAQNSLMQAMTSAFVGAIQNGQLTAALGGQLPGLPGLPAVTAPATPQPSLLEQIAALSTEEKAAVRGLLEGTEGGAPAPSAQKPARATRQTRTPRGN